MLQDETNKGSIDMNGGRSRRASASYLTRAKLVPGLLAATTALVIGAGTHASAAGPVGGCPAGGGWALEFANVVIPGFDQGAIANLDQNGDGKVCYRAPLGFTHANDADPGNGAQLNSWVVKDNSGKP